MPGSVPEVELRVLSRETLPVRCEDDVVIVRRRARELGQRQGFDPFAQAAITTATSEISRNTLVHGGGGSADLEEVERGGRRGVRVTCRDTGPGIVDLARALKGGFSAIGTLGLGLSGARRLVDELDVRTTPSEGTVDVQTRSSEGTVVVFTKWARG